MKNLLNVSIKKTCIPIKNKVENLSDTGDEEMKF